MEFFLGCADKGARLPLGGLNSKTVFEEQFIFYVVDGCPIFQRYDNLQLLFRFICKYATHSINSRGMRVSIESRLPDR